MGTSPTPKPGPKPANSKPKLGLRAWMERVLVECDRAATGFDVDAVHDLRVALRRCRSLADGLMAVDPDSSWKDMKKAGRKLFQALGELRDMQVMAEWIEKLGVASDSAAAGDAARRVSGRGKTPASYKGIALRKEHWKKRREQREGRLPEANSQQLRTDS